MANGNLHRDIDKREQVIECIAGSIVCGLPLDLFVDVRRSVMSHRPNRIRDVPFCARDRSFHYTEGINRNPIKKKI
jgi:hypothetical protein